MGGFSRALRAAGVLLFTFLASACSNGADAVEPLPADQVVFRVGSTGDGWTAAAAQEARSPELLIYGDGRVLAAEPGPSGIMAPPEYRVAQSDPVDVARFAVDLEGRHLVDLVTEVGHPGVTDQATTTITLHGRGEPSEIRVYAFAPRFEDGLSEGALENRESLRAAIAGARSLAAGETELFVPQTVMVYELTAEGPAGTDESADLPQWPGPDPETVLVSRDGAGRGGEVTGDAATLVYAAARTNPDALWRVGDRVVRLVVDQVP
jgi:hypothetical protein